MDVHKKAGIMPKGREATANCVELHDWDTWVVSFLVDAESDLSTLLCRASYRKTAPHFILEYSSDA